MTRKAWRAGPLVAIGLLGGLPAAHGQGTPAPAPETLLPTVKVTGSRLPRVDLETPAPVQVIDREQLERSGVLSVAEALKNLPAANVGSFNETLDGSFSPGSATASLHGLGTQATLVLINGRRVAPFGFAYGGQYTFVDLNQIPLEVVDRVELLLDGASAIYGSDAIGGVINVILRRDFRGVVASGSFGLSSRGDARSRRASLTGGFGSIAEDGFNAFATYEHVDQEPVTASQRPHTRTGDYRRFGLSDLRSSYAYPGNLYQPQGFSGGAFIAPVAGCTPLAEPGAATNGRCIYDPVRHTDVVAESHRDAITAVGTAKLPRGFELFGETTLGRTRFLLRTPSYSTSTLASTGTLDTTYIRLPEGHPQNPLPGQEVALRYRFADVPMVSETVTEAQRAVVGLRHPDLAGWDVESGLLWSHSRTRAFQTGIPNDQVLLDEVLDGDGAARTSFVFGNPGANDPALMARLYPRLRDVGTTTTTSIDLRGTREVMRLPAGPLQLALGAEVRRESFKSTPDPITASGALSTLGSTAADGHRTVSAAFAELSVPVMKDLDASLAARYDRYSDFGSTVNPKLGLKWKLHPMLAIRGTYGTGFRAPAITERTTTPTLGFFGVFRDPRLCPVPDDDNPNCNLEVPGLSGANPDLKAEKSRGVTAGFIFQPFSQLSVSVDTFRIRRRNEIATPQIDYLLAHEDLFPGAVVRGADGSIESLNLTYANIGKTRVSGYDVEIKGTHNVEGVGKLSLTATYDSLPHAYAAIAAGEPERDYAGTYGQPRSRYQVRLGLDRGPWVASVAFNYVGKFQLRGSPDSPPCRYAETDNPGLCTIGSWLTTDLFLSYRPWKALELSLAVNNVADRQPPVNANSSRLFGGSYHSAVGRFFQAGAKYSFR